MLYSNRNIHTTPAGRHMHIRMIQSLINSRVSLCTKLYILKFHIGYLVSSVTTEKSFKMAIKDGADYSLCTRG